MRFNRLIPASWLLVALAACSQSPRPTRHESVTVADKVLADDAAAAEGRVPYVALFADRGQAVAHVEAVRKAGGTASLVAEDGRLVRAEAARETLSALALPADALAVKNTTVRVSPGAAPLDMANMRQDPASAVESFLTVRDVTGVSALVKRFPEADGRGVKVAVFDTGIDFGVEGVSRDGKLLGFYDLTDFGLVKADALADTAPKPSYAVAGATVTVAADVKAKDIVATGVIDEKALAAHYLTPEADVDGDAARNAKIPFITGHDADGREAVWVDLNKNGVISAAEGEELTDFNTTGRYRDTVVSAASPSGARPIAVTIRSLTEVQFHSVPEGHGTSCAIIIAGDGYADGKLRGMAPKAKLLAYVLDATGQDVYTMDQFLKMFLHAKGQGVDAISVSWGFSTADLASARFVADFLDKEIASAGIVIGIAAGNEGPAFVSAAADDYIPRHGFGVGAHVSEAQARNVYGWTGTAQDSVIWYSSFGPTRGGRAMPDVVSPLASFVRGSRTTAAPVFRGFSGTSSATPALIGSVSALVSVLKQHGEAPINARLLKLAVQASAAPVKATESLRQGAGLLNVAQAYDVYRRLAAEWRAANADASHRTRFPYELRAAITVPGQNLPLEGLTLEGRPNAAVVNVRLSAASQALIDPLVTLETLRVSHEKDFLDVPDVLALQATGGAFTVSFRPEALRKPGVYSDVISLTRDDGVVLLRVPVLVRVPSEADASLELARVNAKLGPYGFWRTSVTLRQASALRFSAVVQDLGKQANARLGFYVNTVDGHRVFEDLKPLTASTMTVSSESPVLKAGTYELVLFRHYGQPAVVGGVQVTGTFSLSAVSVKGWDLRDHTVRVALGNDGAKLDAVKAVLTLDGVEKAVTLTKDVSRPRPGFYGAFRLPALASPNVQWGLRQNSVDRAAESFLHMSVAIQDATTGDTLHRGWLDVEDEGSPLRDVALSAAASDGQYAVIAYPNIVRWEGLAEDTVSLRFLAPVAKAATAEVATSPLAAGGVTTLSFTLPADWDANEGAWHGRVELRDATGAVLATVPVKAR